MSQFDVFIFKWVEKYQQWTTSDITDILDLCEWINTNIPKDGINRNTSVYTTYRQTDEQTDRQKDWQTDKQTDRHACLHAHRNAQPLCCVLREIPGTLGVRSTLHLHWSVSLLTWPLTCIPLWSGDLILHHTHCLVILFVFVSIVCIYFFLVIFLQVHLQAFISIRNLHIYIYICIYKICIHVDTVASLHISFLIHKRITTHPEFPPDLLLPRLDLDPTTSFRNEGIETSQERLGGGLLDTNSAGVWWKRETSQHFFSLDLLGELHPKIPGASENFWMF